MNDRIVIRRVGALDLDRAAALHRQAFEPMGERPWTCRDIAELLASPGVAGLLADRDEEAVGLMLWRIVADEAEVLTIAVQSHCRRAGLGRALLDAAIERATQSGARSLFLEVAADNAAARSFYSQAGFEEVGCRPAYYTRRDGFADALVLRLTLIGGG
jgi:ribosomal-protein-alanine N-acetyltransferase